MDTMTPSPPILIRAAVDADRHFIMASWLKYYRDYAWTGIRGKPVKCEHCSHARPSPKPRSPLSNAVYYEGQKEVVERLLDQPDTPAVLVACGVDDPDQIFGWLCAGFKCRPYLHFLYIKRPFRGMGIARQLLDAAGITPDNPAVWTHWVPRAERVLKRYFAGFDPYEAWR